MSYHVAKVLPGTQPMRRFANAHSVWARQLRTIIPNETVAYNARGGRAIGNYAPLPFPLGCPDDGLGGFVNPGAGLAVRADRRMMLRGRLVPAAGLGSTLVVI
jgi:hypothetical protein